MPRALMSAGIGSLFLSLLVAAGVISVSREVPLGEPALATLLPQEMQPLSASVKSAWMPLPSSVLFRLPSIASANVDLQTSGASLGFRLVDAHPVQAVSFPDGVRFPGALGKGTELELRGNEQGVEDSIRFDQSPTSERVEYLLDLRGVAGVRKVGQVIEFVDEGGAPRLRMEAPYIVSATGENIRANVEVGCEHDKDERGPWGRRPVKGGEECRVSVVWSGKGVVYPAVLDPVWSSAASMYDSRTLGVFGLLDSGRLLVAGGRSCDAGNCVALKTTELFDPATGTWAKGADSGWAHDKGMGVNVPGWGFLAIASDSKVSAEASATEVYLEGSGTWEALPPLSVSRREAMVLLTADKTRVLVLGGMDPNIEIPIAEIEVFDLATKQWSQEGTLSKPRYLGSATELPDGRVLIAGGSTCGNCGPVQDVEFYNPLLKNSENGPPLQIAHFGHSAALLQIQGKPKVLIASGGTDETELFDPDTNSWSFAGKMAANRVYFAASVLEDGSYLAAGGVLIPSFEANTIAERFDPISLSWKQAGLTQPSYGAGAFARLQDGRFLLAGGSKNNFLAGTITSKDVEIFQPQVQGKSCGGGGECVSGFCVDGVCCENACQGECMACSSAKKGKGSSADGICGPIALGADPDDECVTQDKSTCGTSGECDGKGACSKYPVNMPCGPATCTDSVSTGLLCAANGKCLQQVVSCAPFRCKDPTACQTSCTSDDQCIPSAHCAEQTCKADLVQGAVCSRSAECQSGFCVDGVCCENACEGTCMACSSKLKQEGGADGICAPALMDSDPHEDCTDEPLLGCDKNGLCDGKGACSLYAAGVECQPPICINDGQGGSLIHEFACDGSGTCKTNQGASCGLFGCEQGACRDQCKEDSDCAESAYCLSATCIARKALGMACSKPSECLGGLCVDGVCCNSPCSGSCEICNKEGALGLCVPNSGPPADGHPTCAQAASDRPCEQLICDGINRDICSAFVGSEVTCRAPSCVDGVATQMAVCNGKGACPEITTVRCEPFACHAEACGSQCTSDADCDRRFQCDIQGDCIPRTIAICDGEHSLINPDGTTTDCAPFKCEGSSCKNQCSSVNDCVLPNVCDKISHSCIPAPPNPTDSAGCQISSIPIPRGGSAPLSLFGLLLLGLRRQQRRNSRLI